MEERIVPLPSFPIFGIDLISFMPTLAEAIALYLVISISLNLELGYAGIPNFGKALFVAVGGGIGGAFAARFSMWVLGVSQLDFLDNPYVGIDKVNIALQTNISFSIVIFFSTLVVAALVGASVGYLSSYPAIRLREDYLAMTLLAGAEFFVIFLRNYVPLIDGADGIPIPDPYVWTGDYRFLTATLVMVVFAILVYLYSERIARSPLGRALRAVRDNEVASEALGKDNVLFRRNTLIVASAITGVAGALEVFYSGYVAPDFYHRFDWTILPWVMVILGGAANNAGVLLGVSAYWSIFKIIDIKKEYFAPFLPFDVNWLQYISVAVILTLILLYRPEGILREKPSATISKSKIVGMISSASSGATKPNEKFIARLRKGFSRKGGASHR